VIPFGSSKFPSLSFDKLLNIDAVALLGTITFNFASSKSPSHFFQMTIQCDATAPENQLVPSSSTINLVPDGRNTTLSAVYGASSLCAKPTAAPSICNTVVISGATVDPASFHSVKGTLVDAQTGANVHTFIDLCNAGRGVPAGFARAFVDFNVSGGSAFGPSIAFDIFVSDFYDSGLGQLRAEYASSSPAFASSRAVVLVSCGSTLPNTLAFRNSFIIRGTTKEGGTAYIVELISAAVCPSPTTSPSLH
jgi:hypothetical protein